MFEFDQNIIGTWILASIIGIFWGSSMFLSHSHNIVATAIVRDHKIISHKWLLYLTFNSRKGTRLSIFPIRYMHLPPWIINTIIILISVYVWHWLLWETAVEKGFWGFIWMEASFPLFLIISWIVPTKLLIKYIRHLPEESQEVEEKHSFK